jgi:hypothetical protein
MFIGRCRDRVETDLLFAQVAFLDKFPAGWSAAKHDGARLGRTGGWLTVCWGWGID